MSSWVSSGLVICILCIVAHSRVLPQTKQHSRETSSKNLARTFIMFQHRVLVTQLGLNLQLCTTPIGLVFTRRAKLLQLHRQDQKQMTETRVVQVYGLGKRCYYQDFHFTFGSVLALARTCFASSVKGRINFDAILYLQHFLLCQTPVHFLYTPKSTFSVNVQSARV